MRGDGEPSSLQRSYLHRDGPFGRPPLRDPGVRRTDPYEKLKTVFLTLNDPEFRRTRRPPDQPVCDLPLPHRPVPTPRPPFRTDLVTKPQE